MREEMSKGEKENWLEPALWIPGHRGPIGGILKTTSRQIESEYKKEKLAYNMGSGLQN
jgi:hypothetical protein